MACAENWIYPTLRPSFSRTLYCVYVSSSGCMCHNLRLIRLSVCTFITFDKRSLLNCSVMWYALCCFFAFNIMLGTRRYFSARLCPVLLTWWCLHLHSLCTVSLCDLWCHVCAISLLCVLVCLAYYIVIFFAFLQCCLIFPVSCVFDDTSATCKWCTLEISPRLSASVCWL